MSTKTTNLELTKPAYGESADIAVINANMDTLDTAVAGKVTAPSGTVTANTAVVFDGTTGKAVKSSGKTLGTACSKNYTTEVTSGSANLVTSGGVYNAIPRWRTIWSATSYYTTLNTDVTLTDTSHRWTDYVELELITCFNGGTCKHTVISTLNLDDTLTTATWNPSGWNTVNTNVFDAIDNGTTDLAIMFLTTGGVPKFRIISRGRSNIGIWAIRGKI